MPVGPSISRPIRGKNNRFQRNFNKDEHRINERIRVPQVRLIDEEGNQVGVVDTRDALEMARSKNLDLMEVAPEANPPVCKITDYGKFKYEKKKKEQQAKKKQSTTKVKEVQLRPHTGEHDLDYKFKNVRTFLEDGDKAKITMLFRGREMAHTEPGYKIMRELADKMKDIAVVEAEPKLEGRRMIMILAPAGAKAAAAPAKKAKIRPVSNETADEPAKVSSESK